MTADETGKVTTAGTATRKYPLGNTRKAATCGVCLGRIEAGGRVWRIGWVRAHPACGWDFNYPGQPVPAEVA